MPIGHWSWTVKLGQTVVSPLRPLGHLTVVHFLDLGAVRAVVDSKDGIPSRPILNQASSLNRRERLSRPTGCKAERSDQWCNHHVCEAVDCVADEGYERD